MNRLVVVTLVIALAAILGTTTVLVLRQRSQIACMSNDQDWCQFTKIIRNKQDSYFIPYGPGMTIITDSSGVQSKIVTTTDGKNIKIVLNDIQMIMVGDTIYQKNGDDDWKSANASSTTKQFFLGINDRIKIKNLLSVKPPQKIGTEPCENRTCLVYDSGMRIVDGENAGFGVSFDTDEYLARRVKQQFQGSTYEWWPSYVLSSPIMAPI